MIKEINHTLLEKFQYSDNGSLENYAEIITVNAPTGKQGLKLNIIKSLVDRAEKRSMGDLAKLMNQITSNISELKQVAEVQKIDENEKSYSLYTDIISGLDEKEIAQLRDTMKAIFIESAVINNEKSFESVFFEDMSIYDIDIIMGRYIENFTNLPR